MNRRLLKFYVAEKQRHRHMLVYQWLLDEAQRLGLPGGSACRAVAGFGRHGRRHDEHFFELAGDLPVEVDFVVTAQDAQRFLEHLADQGLDLFYLQVPVEAGFVGDRET